MIPPAMITTLRDPVIKHPNTPSINRTTAILMMFLLSLVLLLIKHRVNVTTKIQKSPNGVRYENTLHTRAAPPTRAPFAPVVPRFRCEQSAIRHRPVERDAPLVDRRHVPEWMDRRGDQRLRGLRDPAGHESPDNHAPQPTDLGQQTAFLLPPDRQFKRGRYL